jgi:hypothetical protein
MVNHGARRRRADEANATACTPPVSAHKRARKFWSPNDDDDDDVRGDDDVRDDDDDDDGRCAAEQTFSTPPRACATGALVTRATTDVNGVAHSPNQRTRLLEEIKHALLMEMEKSNDALMERVKRKSEDMVKRMMEGLQEHSARIRAETEERVRRSIGRDVARALARSIDDVCESTEKRARVAKNVAHCLHAA